MRNRTEEIAEALKKMPPKDRELTEIGLRCIEILRRPDAQKALQEAGAKCPHGPMCAVCLEVFRVDVARIQANQGEVQA